MILFFIAAQKINEMNSSQFLTENFTFLVIFRLFYSTKEAKKS